MIVLGLMSGTSLDGVDALLVELDGDTPASLRWRVIHGSTMPYDEQRRSRIHHAIVAGSAESLCRLNVDLGEWFAEAALRTCAEAGIPPERVDLVGSHGQTLWHAPPSGGIPAATLQLGDPATIAERLGAAVVSDFRARDVAAGGQGAPLVPWVDQVLFGAEGRTRALQNIGGIGNVSWIPPRGSDAPVIAFDTGPGNALIDAAVEIATGGKHRYDPDGTLARGGRVDQGLLEELLRHPFFAEPPPRSTGREAFGRPFVERLIERLEPEGDRDWLDLIATLTELTARSIADSYRAHLRDRGLDEVVITGGGAKNRTLVERLGALLAPLPILGSAELGLETDLKEALAFAVLAWAHVHSIPANVPSATGARGPRILGSYTPGARAPTLERS